MTPQVTGSCQTVLVADDDAPMRELLVLALEQASYRVLIASDGAEALAVARAEQPDLVLLDAEMPRVHGFEVCQQLKSSPETSGIRVLFLTAKTLPHERARGLAMGADGYITKPFSPRALIATVRQELGEP